MRSSIASEPVTKPARRAQGVPRPSMETPTTRPTPCLLNASAAGRVKPAKAASTEGAQGSAGVSQKTASAPANALSTTAASPCDPSTMSRSSRTSAGSCDGSRAMTRSCSPLSSRLPSTWRPIWPTGVVMTIMGTSNADVDIACRYVCRVRPSQGEDDALVHGAGLQLAVGVGGLLHGHGLVRAQPQLAAGEQGDRLVQGAEGLVGFGLGQRDAEAG